MPPRKRADMLPVTRSAIAKLGNRLPDKKPRGKPDPAVWPPLGSGGTQSPAGTGAPAELPRSRG